MWRVVMRPWWLRPPLLLCFSSSAACGAPLCSPGVNTRTIERRPGEVGLKVINAIGLSSGRGRHHVDRLAFGQRHVRLAPIATATLAELEGLGLALHVHHVHRFDLDVEDLLHGDLDVGLGGGLRDFENVLVGNFLQARGLLGHARRTDHFVHVGGAHASHSSIFLTASEVMTTVSAPTSATGSRPCTSRTCTYGRLRAERYTFSVASSVTISGRRPTLSSFSSATMPEVFGLSSARPSTTVIRPWRLSSDRIAAIAARYILRLTFCSKLRGLAAKVTPPPTKIGAVSAPWRAPPPFCFFDFLVVPLTSERVFCALVPARPALR